MVNSWTTFKPSSMLTAAVMVGLSAGDALAHNKATLIILSASSSLNSDPNSGSTNSIKLPFCCKTIAWSEKRREIKSEKETKEKNHLILLLFFLIIINILLQVSRQLASNLNDEKNQINS